MENKIKIKNNADFKHLLGTCCIVLMILFLLLFLTGHSNAVTSENMTGNIAANNTPYENITVTDYDSHFIEDLWGRKLSLCL